MPNACCCVRLAVDPTVAPIGDGDWRSNASLASVQPLTGLSRKAVEGYHLKSWKWARSASQAALELAELHSSNVELAAEAQRIAKRHDGVWRAANKLVKVDTAGKETRAIVAVRSDSGDSTCPTFLERQGRKRAREMWPIVNACKMLGYQIAWASSPPIKRERIEEALSYFGDKNYRSLHNIIGMDIIIVPQSDGNVIAYILAAFKDGIQNVALPVQLDFAPIIDIERIYSEPANAALSMGPKLWIGTQLLRWKDGKRTRDRLSYGVFYGKASEQVIVEAAGLEREKLGNEASATLRDVEAKIAQSIDLTNRCIAVGDAEAAHAAYGFVGAYLFDAHVDLAEYSVLLKSLEITSRVDFSGLTDAPGLGSTHDLLMTEVRSLAHPKPYALPAWRCIELVTVHNPDDILRLIDWVRENQD